MSTFKVFKYYSYLLNNQESEDRHVFNVEAKDLPTAIRKVKEEVKSVRSFKVEDFLVNEWVDIRFALRTPRLGKHYVHYRIELDKKDDVKIDIFNVFKATPQGSMDLMTKVEARTIIDAISKFRQMSGFTRGRLVGQNNNGILYNFDGCMYLISDEKTKSSDIPINNRKEGIEPMKYATLQDVVLSLTVGQKIRSNSGKEFYLMQDGKFGDIEASKMESQYCRISLDKKMFEESWYIASVKTTMQDAMDKLNNGIRVYFYLKDNTFELSDKLANITLSQLAEAKWFYEPSERVL